MSSGSRKPKEIFLSHSSKDRKFAQQLADKLQVEYGLRVWFSPSSLRGADAWHDEIGKALKRCDWLVILLTPSAVRSRWVKHELVFALSERRYQDRIVPVKVKPCDTDKLSWVLRNIEQIQVPAGPTIVARKLGALWKVPPKN